MCFQDYPFRFPATFQPKCLLLIGGSILIAFFPRYCITVFASDGTGEAEFVLFDRVAAGAVGRPLAALLRKRYPGHNTPEDIAIAARHDTGVPAEISSLVGRKFKFLVCISKKWSSKNNSYSSDDSLSFQVSRIEEAYKPELPPLISGNAAGSGEASSSAGGLGANVPHLGAAISTARHTPSAPASVSKQGLRPGQGSPMGKVCLLGLFHVSCVKYIFYLYACD
jgi:hypothetical protein